MAVIGLMTYLIVIITMKIVITILITIIMIHDIRCDKCGRNKSIGTACDSSKT